MIMGNFKVGDAVVAVKQSNGNYIIEPIKGEKKNYGQLKESTKTKTLEFEGIKIKI